MKRISLIVSFLLLITNVHSQNCYPATAFDYLDINNVKARINNGGDMWWDLVNDAEYLVPKSGNGSALFAGALWIGGLDAQGNLHVAAQTFRQNGNDFFPGPLDASGNVTAQMCDSFDRIWKINKSTIDSFTSGLFGITPSSITHWPGRSNPNLSFLPDQDLAPFMDLNGDNGYNPADGEYPAIPGDQALWYVFNDNGNTHSQTEGNALGIEVQCLAYAFKDSNTCTYSTTLYHYQISNKSANNYDSVFIGLWNVNGLGCFVDDYIGTDSANNLGVVYNGQAVDASACAYSYGSNLPVLAFQLLQGPTDDDGTIHYLDHSMTYYGDYKTGNPVEAIEYYEYLQSIWRNGSHLTFGGNGIDGAQPTNFIYSGDPQDPNGWSECAMNNVFGSKRLILSSGPVHMLSGQTKTFDIAAVWDNTSVYPCPSFDIIDSVAACVKNYFDNIVFITGTENISSQQPHLNVFPNPVAISSDINFSGKNISRVEIFDLAGKKFFDSEVMKNGLKLNSDRLGKGLFVYRITYNDHSLKSGKIVVQ